MNGAKPQPPQALKPAGFWRGAKSSNPRPRRSSIAVRQRRAELFPPFRSANASLRRGALRGIFPA